MILVIPSRLKFEGQSGELS